MTQAIFNKLFPPANGAPMRFIALGILWLAFSIGTVGFLNANLRATFPELMQSPRQAREQLAFSIGISLLPPTWFVIPFLTGFYQDGWTLTGAPLACTKNPEIWCR